MIRKFTLAFITTALLAPSVMFGAAGIFGSDIGLKSNKFNAGGNTFFEATLLGDARQAPLANGAVVTLPVTLNTTGFNGLNLGTFNPFAGDTLLFIGGEALTFKNGTTDVTGTAINYKIDGGAFTPFSLTFNEDNVSGSPGDQRWANTDQAVNLLSGLSLGAHTLQFFTSGTTNDVGAIFDNAGGANFTASFTVVPEPATVLLIAPALLGGMFFVRRRRA